MISCPVCGRPSRSTKERVDCSCGVVYETETNNVIPKASGPGTNLARIIAKKGFRKGGGCSCEDSVNTMDRNGVEWCEENEEQILNWLQESAAKRRLPFIRFVVRRWVRKAIRQARNEFDMQNFFDRVYCITLQRRNDRWQQFLANMPEDWPFKQPIKFTAIDGEKVRPPQWFTAGRGAWGCYRSHLQIIETCLNEKTGPILILEDDAVFGYDFNKRVRDYLQALPSNWGIAYLGGQHRFVQQHPPKQKSKNVYCPYDVNRTHAYAISPTYMQRVYTHLTTQDWSKGHHIDHHYAKLMHKQNQPIYAPAEWLVGQAKGKSDISHKTFGNRYWESAERLAKHTLPPFYMVLGLHSSGSSCLAGVLHHLGVFIGTSLKGFYGNDPESYNCGYEASGLMDICEAAIPFPKNKVVRPEMRKRLRRWVLQTRKQAKQKHTVAGGKYPMLCQLGDTLLDIPSDELRVIVSDRPVEDSIRSLQRRCPHIKPQTIREHQLWLEDGKQKLLSSLDYSQVLTVPYYSLLEDPEYWVWRIGRFLKLELSDEILEQAQNAVNPNKQHIGVSQ